MLAFFRPHFATLTQALAALVLLVLLCPAPAQAACSSYRGAIVFNEVQIPNAATAYVELRVLNPAIVAATNNFTGWTVSANRKKVSNGTTNSTTVNLNSIVTNTGVNTCGPSSAWIQIPDASIGTYLDTGRHDYDLNYVLYDASGNMVDLLRVAEGTPSSFYSGAGSQCTTIEPSPASTFNARYDFRWQNGNSIKDWFRTVDGTGTWTGTETANNTNSICGSNDVGATRQVGLNKVASVGTVNTGVGFSYTLYAQNPNTGTARSNVVVTDVLPSGVSFISCTATAPDTCVNASGTVTFTVSALPINATRSAVLTVSASTTGAKVNTITTPSDTAGVNSTASATVTVSATAPVVTTVAAASVTATTATLNGTVNPTSVSTTVALNYGQFSGSYTSTCTPATSTFTGSTTQAFSCAVTGLTCGTTYYFQATGTNTSSVTSNGLELSFTTSSCGASFDAYETSYTTSQAIAGSARIKTHVASGSGLCVNGGACDVTIGVFDGGKTALQTGFTGPVKVEIVDASSGTCASYALIATVSASLTLDTSGVTTPVVLPAVANAFANARIRVSYPASGTATSQSCSSDNFAIRPGSFASVSVKDATSSTAGSTNALTNKVLATTSPIHKAGRPFSLNATAVNVSNATTTNYSGTPTAVLTACTGGTACADPTGRTLAPGSAFVAGVLGSVTATYNGVGAFSMVLQDGTFADVDLSDSSQTERTISATAMDVGRFVPDHFDTVLSSQGCVTFTYSGQPFSLKVLAKDASGATLAQYANATGLANFVTLSDANAAAGGFGTTAPLASGYSVATFTAGEATDASTPLALTYSFSSRATAPTVIKLRATDADGIDSATGTTGLAASATEASTTIVSGRLNLLNAYGSEQLALPLPARVEYYDTVTSAGWRQAGGSYADACTKLVAAQFAFTTTASACATPPASCVSALAVTATASAGVYLAPWTVALGKPTSAGSACVTLSLDGLASGKQCTATGTPGASATSAGASWLKYPWTGSAASNPTARVNFGVYKSPLVYLRENY